MHTDIGRGKVTWSKSHVTGQSHVHGKQSTHAGLGITIKDKLLLSLNKKRTITTIAEQ